MYRKLFHYPRKINKKNLIIILAVLFVLIMVGGYFGLRQDARVTTIDKIKSYLSNETEFDNETGQLTDDALSLEETKEVLGEETTTAPKLTLEEISEQVNEVSKEVAIVSIQVQILTLEKISSEIAEKDDLDEDTLENISEEINQVSEQIESIMLQLEQF